jgi:hypothetical protein
MDRDHRLDPYLYRLRAGREPRAWLTVARRTHHHTAKGGVDERHRPFRDGPLWWLTKDGDLCVRDLFRSHYSSARSKKVSDLFVGPGEKIVLRSAEGDSGFAWRHSRYRRDGQVGVECAIFCNRGPHLSSILIRQADAIADFCWPGLRHYTFVDPKAVRSSYPGACFEHAGWRRCRGKTTRGLIVFERLQP